MKNSSDSENFYLVLRFNINTKHFSHCLQVLGLGSAWKGGSMKKVAGGGHKVNLLKEELHKYKDDPNKIIMFTDRYVVSEGYCHH